MNTNPTNGQRAVLTRPEKSSTLRAKGGRRRLVLPTLVFSDVLLAFLVWSAALVLRNIWGDGGLTEVSRTSIVTNVMIWVGARALLGLYPGYGFNAAEELRRQTYAVTVALAVAAISALAFQVGDLLSRLLLILGFLGLALLAPLGRHFVKRGLRRIGWWGKPVVILGAGESVARMVRALREEWGLGLVPLAVFDDREIPAGGGLVGIPYGGTLSDAKEMARNNRVDTAILASPLASHSQIADLVAPGSASFRHLIVIPDLAGAAFSAVVARDLGGTFGIEFKHNLLNPWTRRAKRALDFGAAAVGGVLISPLFLALILLVLVERRGPVFYRDYRMGRDGRLFSCLKFRTMVADAEVILQRLLEEEVEAQEEYFRHHKLRDDPRVTRVGRFLRKTSLDELPQLWNVLRGEMSLVGPRPYLPRESGDIGSVQAEILNVPPGITGFWQVSGRSSTSFDERVKMDAYYVRNWSVWQDIVILVRTIKSVSSGGGAY